MKFFVSNLRAMLTFAIIGIFLFENQCLAEALSIRLSDAEKQALQFDRRIKKAEENIAIAESELSAAWSNMLPTVKAELSGATHHDRKLVEGQSAPPTTARDRNQYSADLVLSQSLFSGFSGGNTIRAKQEKLSKNKMQLDAIKNSVRKEIAILYFQIELNFLEVSVEKEAMDLRKKQLADVKNKARQGRSTKLEVLQAEYAVQSQIPIIAAIQAEIERLSLQFARILGLKLDTKFKLSDSLQVAQKAIDMKNLPVISEAYKRALANYANFRAKQIELEETKLTMRSVTAKHLPTLDLVLTASTDANLRSEIGDSDSLSYSGELQLNIPIFSGLSSFSEKNVNIHNLNVLMEDIALEREKILEDIANFYRAISIAEEKIKAETLNVVLAERTVSQAQLFYNSGKSTLTEVLDSYSRLVSARKQLGSAMFDKMEAFLNIRSLIGVQ
ncbi:MAG: TolC family protein [Bdellovibrionota bacterium]